MSKTPVRSELWQRRIANRTLFHVVYHVENLVEHMELDRSALQSIDCDDDPDQRGLVAALCAGFLVEQDAFDDAREWFYEVHESCEHEHDFLLLDLDFDGPGEYDVETLGFHKPISDRALVNYMWPESKDRLAKWIVREHQALVRKLKKLKKQSRKHA